MKTTMLFAGGLALSLFGTGCVATHKYVAKTVAPVEQRVSSAESKNADQDKQLAAEGTQIESLDRDLSRTKERLNDTDNKATQAGSAAQAADQKAQGAQSAADGARTLAQQGMDKTTQLSSTVDDLKVDKMRTVKSDMVLFGLNQRTLSNDAKSKLDDLAKSFDGLQRFVIEIQGYTDKTGPVEYNAELSQARADAVARYLAREHKVPLHNITVLGTGIAEGEGKTRDDRKMDRKVEIRVLVPEVLAGNNSARN